MRRFLLHCATIAIALFAVPSLAEPNSPESTSSSEFIPAGFYASISALAMLDEFDTDIPLATLPVDKVDESFGVSAWLGMRTNRHFAVEAQFDWIEGFDVRLDNGHKGRPHTDLEGWILTTNAKLYLPLGRLQPFAKVGVGAIELELKANDGDRLSGDPKRADFVTRFGAGLEIYATRSVVLVMAVDYVIPMDELEDFPFLALNLGFQYRF